MEEKYIKTYESFFKKIGGFFKEKPGKDDEIGEKIYNYIIKNDLSIDRKFKGDDTIYKFMIRSTNKDFDPYGEETFDDDILITVIEETSFEYWDVNIRINDDGLNLHSKIRYKILEAIEDKKRKNIQKEKEDRFNKYKKVL